MDRGQPTAQSTVERLLAQSEARDKQVDLSKEEWDEFKKVANNLLSSKNGIFFWRKIKRLMGINKISRDFTPLSMAARQSLNNLNLIVEGLLDNDVKNKLNEEE
jgi:hypothetical protein